MTNSEALKRIDLFVKTAYPIGDDFKEALQVAIDILTNDQWVSVTYHLPESKDALVTVYFSQTGSVETVHIQDYFDNITDGLDENGNQLYTKWYLHQEVTHWKPYNHETPDHA